MPPNCAQLCAEREGHTELTPLLSSPSPLRLGSGGTGEFEGLGACSAPPTPTAGPGEGQTVARDQDGRRGGRVVTGGGV